VAGLLGAGSGCDTTCVGEAERRVTEPVTSGGRGG
jgi:hypothetical protein